jgi:hypothetical protein
MRRFHKPDDDKRSVVILPTSQCDEAASPMNLMIACSFGMLERVSRKSPQPQPYASETLFVKAGLEAIDFEAREVGPRLLRNTYARRKRLQGRSNSDVSALLGLVSLRTVHRIRQTMPATDEDCAA